MNTRQLNTILIRPFALLMILVITFSGARPVSAGNASPFVGNWQATDVDGSEMHLGIGGPPSGPFRITWGDQYISFCGGEAGLIRGTGFLDPGDAYLLEADLHLECFASGSTLDFHLTLRYHPGSDMLSMHYDDGMVTIWQHAGQAPAAPFMGLRVNYGHDWVESFYEGGHTVWLTVTDSEGAVKASAEVVTEPKDFWGGETGFQSRPEDWVPGQPDIQPYDWVYAWVDNGASSQVEIGEINGAVDLLDDSIVGTVTAPWFTDELEIGCHPWGSPLPVDMVYDWTFPDGVDTYGCSWAGMWNILPYQDIGVGYSGADGHWVANAIFASAPRIVASESGNWFWASGFAPGMLDLSIYESELDGEGVNLLWSGQQEADEGGFTIIGQDIHGIDLVERNYIVVSDGVYPKGLALLPTTVTVFDTINEAMAGVAPAGSLVWAMAGPMEWQQPMVVQADPVSGEWLADFASIGFDITEDMRPWSYSHIYDGDGDANEGSTPPLPTFIAWLDWNSVDGSGWAEGEWITLRIADLVLTELAGPSVHFDVGAAGHDIVPGDLVQMTDGHTTKELVIPQLGIVDYNLGANTIGGVYDPGLAFNVYVYDRQLVDLTFDGSTWTAAFDELTPLQWGDAVQTDADFDMVAATIRTPQPMFYVVPEEDQIFAAEWTPGETLTVEVNGETIALQGIPSDGSPYGPEVMFDLFGIVDLQAGDTIILKDGRSTKDLFVPVLEVQEIDPSTHTISGIAAPGALFIGVNGTDFWITVGEDGTWSVSSPEYEPGEYGSAIIWDEDGDQTRDIFFIPYP